MAVIYDGQDQGGTDPHKREAYWAAMLRDFAKYIGSIIGVLRAWVATGAEAY